MSSFSTYAGNKARASGQSLSLPLSGVFNVFLLEVLAGPMKTDLSEGGKVFAGLYALYSGIVVIAVAGLLLAPAIHRVMHRVHWDDQS